MIFLQIFRNNKTNKKMEIPSRIHQTKENYHIKCLIKIVTILLYALGALVRIINN